MVERIVNHVDDGCMLFYIFVTTVAVAAGAIASVTGFGIGSLLTPAFGLQVSTKIAVAAVSVPHVVGTALRFRLLARESIATCC